jgi:hypothetical protein
MLIGGRKQDTAGIFYARVRVGRLVELSIAPLHSRSDVVAFCTQVDAAAAMVDGSIVICADYRESHAFHPIVAEYWAQHMRRYNKRIVRSAILLSPDNATFNLQMERVVRVVGSPARRLFYQATLLCEWLEEVLTKEERVELGRFLSVGDSSGVRPISDRPKSS